jgi:5'-methylthioadenosine phosphorylase
MTQAVLGIIGGSGIYDLPGLKNVRERRIDSPWGEPSAPLRVGDIDGLPIVFLSRHDKGHRLSPSDINYRANIDALKRSGVTDVISVSACGSFKQELYPGLFVLVDQFIDMSSRTKRLAEEKEQPHFAEWFAELIEKAEALRGAIPQR